MHLHLVAYPLGPIPFVLFIPAATILGRVRMGLATSELFAVWAWVRWVLGAAARATAVATVSTTSTSASVIAALITAVGMPMVGAGPVGRGVAVVLNCGCGFGDIGVGFGICCMEEVGEEEHLFGDCVGHCNRGGCIGEFVYTVCTSELA